MTFKSILAFGDSTTAGCELIANSTNWEETKQLSFANILAKKLDVPCFNCAWPGGSNDRSLRLLPETLLEYPDSLVLFTYTSFDRNEFFIPKELNSDTYPDPGDQYRPVGINWLSVKTNNEHHDLNKLYLKKFFSSRVGFNNFKEYNMLLMVQLLCEKFAKDYIQIFLYPNLLQRPDFQQKTFRIINKKKIYQFDKINDPQWHTNNQGFGNLHDWSKYRGYKFCPGGHIGQEAHEQFALTLFNYINDIS